MNIVLYAVGGIMVGVMGMTGFGLNTLVAFNTVFK
jgi:hypothetical protein